MFKKMFNHIQTQHLIVSLLVFFFTLSTVEASFYRGSCLKVTKCLNSRCTSTQSRYGNGHLGRAYQAEPDEQVYVMVAISQPIGRIRSRAPNRRYFGRPLCADSDSATCSEGEVIAYETTTALTSGWSRKPVYTESRASKQVYLGAHSPEMMLAPQHSSYQFARWKTKLNTGYRLDYKMVLNRWTCGWWNHGWLDWAGEGWYYWHYRHYYKKSDDQRAQKLGTNNCFRMEYYTTWRVSPWWHWHRRWWWEIGRASCRERV